MASAAAAAARNVGSTEAEIVPARIVPYPPRKSRSLVHIRFDGSDYVEDILETAPSNSTGKLSGQSKLSACHVPGSYGSAVLFKVCRIVIFIISLLYYNTRCKNQTLINLYMNFRLKIHRHYL